MDLGGREYHVDFLEPQKNIFSLLIDGRSFEVDVDAPDTSDVFEILIKGDHYEVEMVEEKKKKLAHEDGQGRHAGARTSSPPWPATCARSWSSPGTGWRPGQVLLILEAMKMQNEIKSPIDGIVGSVTARRAPWPAAIRCAWWNPGESGDSNPEGERLLGA